MAKAKRTSGHKCEHCGITQGRGKKHKPDCPKASGTGVSTKRAKGDLLAALDGRTKISTLLRLQAKIEALLTDKDKGEVKKTRDALGNVEKLRQQLEEAEKLIA